MAVAVECRLPDRSASHIGNEQVIPVLVESEAGDHKRPRTLSVGRITRYWCHGYRPLRQQPDVTPYTADSVDEIDLIRHRLDAKNLFTPLIRIHCVFTHTTPRCNLPNSSTTRRSVRSSEVSFLIKGDGLGSRNA